MLRGWTVLAGQGHIYSFQASPLSPGGGHVPDICIQTLADSTPPHRQCNTQSDELLPHLPLFSSCQGWPNVCAPCPQLSQISACLACTHGPTSRPVGWLRGNTSDRQHSRPERRPRLGTELVTLVRAAGLAGAFLMCQHLCKNMSQLRNTDRHREAERLARRHPRRCFLHLSLSTLDGAGRSLS